MSLSPPITHSSGDLLADRRFAIGREFERRGDLLAASDLLRQALDRAPDFPAGWFALGELLERSGDAIMAIEAFRRVLQLDPADVFGAGVHLARLGASDASRPMSVQYVRALFDQYAARYDAALERDLAYRGPALLRAAVARGLAARGRPPRFRRMLDLGCGTGLAGVAFADCCDVLVGIDLAPAMIGQARRKEIYAEFIVGDILDELGRGSPGGADLVIAADALAYFGDLSALCGAVHRALAPRGLFAFTVETHSGGGVLVQETRRFAHGEDHVRAALGTGFDILEIGRASARTEKGAPVPGLVIVAMPIGPAPGAAATP